MSEIDTAKGYHAELCRQVLIYSVEKINPYIAMTEWDIVRVIDKSSGINVRLVDEGGSFCHCGKHIHFMFTIKNKRNGCVMYPIGSSCIEQFNDEGMNKAVKILKKSEMTYKPKGVDIRHIGEKIGEICKNDPEFVECIFTHYWSSVKRENKVLLEYYDFAVRKDYLILIAKKKLEDARRLKNLQDEILRKKEHEFLIAKERQRYLTEEYKRICDDAGIK